MKERRFPDKNTSAANESCDSNDMLKHDVSCCAAKHLCTLFLFG